MTRDSPPVDRRSLVIRPRNQYQDRMPARPCMGRRRWAVCMGHWVSLPTASRSLKLHRNESKPPRELRRTGRWSTAWRPGSSDACFTLNPSNHHVGIFIRTWRGAVLSSGPPSFSPPPSSLSLLMMRIAFRCRFVCACIISFQSFLHHIYFFPLLSASVALSSIVIVKSFTCMCVCECLMRLKFNC